MKGLFKNLCKTFFAAVILSLTVNTVYYALTRKPDAAAYSHIVPLLIIGSIFINLIIGIMTLPTLFLSAPRFWDNRVTRYALYFSGPVVFIIAALSAGLHKGDQEFYLSTGLIFLLIHFIYYRLITSNKQLR
jgi:hypothetical protein